MFGSDFDDPIERLAPVAAIVIALVMLFFAFSREPSEPTPQDAMDGIYEREGCPGFVIEGGTIRFEGGTIAGVIDRAKRGYVIETQERALRYSEGAGGCRLESADARALLLAERKSFASPVIMISLVRSDRKATAYWTRIGPISVSEAPNMGEQT